MIKKAKYASWWLFATISFLIFIVLQIPAAWLVTKFYKNNQNLHNISGNIWNGQADWQKGKLTGTVSWHYRPLDLLLLKISADTQVYSGQTKFKGVLSYRFGNVMLQSVNGEIAPETLESLNSWQWPSSKIIIKDLNVEYKKSNGFDQTSGNIQWGGGELTYTFAQRQEHMNAPALKGNFLSDQEKLILDLHDQKEQKIAHFALDADLMLDIQLTQRMMLNVPSYDGKAAMDTYVVSVRQPLIRGE